MGVPLKLTLSKEASAQIIKAPRAKAA